MGHGWFRRTVLTGVCAAAVSGCAAGATGDPQAAETRAYLDVATEVYPAATDAELLGLVDSICAGIDDTGGDAPMALTMLTAVMVADGTDTDGLDRVFAAATAVGCPEYADQLPR